MAAALQGNIPRGFTPFYLGFLSFCIMLAKEAKACSSPWSACWLHSSLKFEKSHDYDRFSTFVCSFKSLEYFKVIFCAILKTKT